MTGNQEEKPDPWQYSQNHTGHECRCAVCLKKCHPVAIDGGNIIPVCFECWKPISPTNKLTIVAFYRNSKAVNNLANSIETYVSHQGIVGGSFCGKKSSEN